MTDLARLPVRFAARLLLSVLLLAVASRGFGLHHHADGQSHPESCALCDAAATPLVAPPEAPVLPSPERPPLAAADLSYTPPESRVSLPPGRAPPRPFV